MLRYFRFLILVVLAGTAFADAVPDGVIEPHRAILLAEDSTRPPRRDDPNWQPVELPSFWGAEAVPGRLGGWYRLRFSVSRPKESWGILIWRLHMNAGVWFNGEFIGDGGRLDEPVARNWNRPLYFALPAGLWREGENEVLIRLKVSPGYGLLAPPDIGPERVLRPLYERRLFFQIEVSTALALLLVACGLFMVALWWHRRSDQAYLWFGLSCLFWALLSAYLFVRDPPVDGELFRWLAHVSADGWIACLTLFAFRFLGEHHRRVERLVLGLPAVAALAGLYSLRMPTLMFDIFRISHGFSILVAAGLAVHALRRWRAHRRRDAALLATVLGAIVLSGCHDWLLELPYQWVDAETRIAMMRDEIFMLAYAAPAAFLFLAGHLVRRFVHAMNELEILRDDLEARVEAGRQALEASFRQQRALERSQAAAEERERIHRDLHDDLGAKLLALVIGADNRLRADLARAALQDLRDVVSRSSRGDAPLAELCADWRSEIEQRLTDAGIELEWDQPDDLPDPMVHASDALHLSRILREAVSNAMRHAEATCIRVAIGYGEEGIELVVEDDGKGFSGLPQRIGRGLRNMRHRAEQIGADIQWEPGHLKGCRVRLRVPQARFAPA